MPQASHAASGQAFVIARVLAAPAVALGLLLSIVFAVQPAAASEAFTPQDAVVQGTLTDQAVHLVPAGFKRHGHFKGPIYKHHGGFKKHGFFKHGHGFKRGSFFKGPIYKSPIYKSHGGFKRHGVFKHGHGFRKGFFRGHRGFRSGFFKGHRRYH